MIDFVKYLLMNYNKELLLNSPLLMFFDKVNNKTGELSTYQNAFYKGLEFKIYYPTDTHKNGRITVEGSLHKYWNNGAHNFNDFNINSIDEVRQELEDIFNIDFKNCILKQLEIGVNILPPVPTKKILNALLIFDILSPSLLPM